MKSRLLVPLVVIAVVLAAVAVIVNAQRPPITIQRPPLLRPIARGPEIRFSAKLDPSLFEKGAKLNVYKLGPPKLNESSLGKVAQQVFGGELKGEPTRAGQLVAISDANRPSNFIMLDRRSGYLSLDRGLADQIDEKPGDLPNEAAAQKLSLNLFEQLGLLPANPKELVFDRMTHIYSASYDPATGREGRPLVQALVVYFARQLDGVPVIGPGSKLIARIGDGGKVVGASVRWREVANPENAGKLGVRTPPQVQRAISAFLARELNEAERIDVNQVGLFYLDRDEGYIQPVIGYEATILRGRGLKETYFGQTGLLLRPLEGVQPGAVDPKLVEAVLKAPQELQVKPEDND